MIVPFDEVLIDFVSAENKEATAFVPERSALSESWIVLKGCTDQR